MPGVRIALGTPGLCRSPGIQRSTKPSAPQFADAAQSRPTVSPALEPESRGAGAWTPFILLVYGSSRPWDSSSS